MASFAEQVDDNAQAAQTAVQLAAGQDAGDRDRHRLALAPPKVAEGDGSRRAPAMPSMATLLGSLAVVIGLFLIVAWVVRLGLPKVRRCCHAKRWKCWAERP